MCVVCVLVFQIYESGYCPMNKITLKRSQIGCLLLDSKTVGIYTLLKKLKEHFDIMIFIERYPLKRCHGCVKLIASKVNCFLNINDLSEVQLCMSSNSWT